MKLKMDYKCGILRTIIVLGIIVIDSLFYLKTNEVGFLITGMITVAILQILNEWFYIKLRLPLEEHKGYIKGLLDVIRWARDREKKLLSRLKTKKVKKSKRRK